MNTNMNYMKMLRKIPKDRLCLIEDGISYTYGDIVRLAEKESRKLGKASPDSELSLSKAFPFSLFHGDSILEQLVLFFASEEAGKIPVILPKEIQVDDTFKERVQTAFSMLEDKEKICMGVCTSGSKGIPKIYFRTFESWADFFPVQNQIFGVKNDSRLFAHGSLSFTGNLNLYLAQFSVGASVIASNTFAPKHWLEQCEFQNADSIYLIPDKLFCLPRIAKKTYPAIKNIISGSQGFGKKEAALLKKIFPNAKITLYYGASELNYITYINGDEMTEETDLIGRAFPHVEIMIKNKEIFVTTDYHVSGITCPYTLSDTGYIDRNDMLHFTGRSDDIVNLHGRKVSTYRIEQTLSSLPGIREAAVLCDDSAHLQAFVTLNDSDHPDLTGELKQRLSSFEIPKRITILESMPHNDSGKISKKTLKRLYHL